MIEQNTLAEEAAKLREQLRNERRNNNSTGATSPGALQSSREPDAENRPNSKDARGDAKRTRGRSKPERNSSGSAQGSAERSGSDGGRSEYYSSGATGGGGEAPGLSNGLMRGDAPVETKNPVGRPRKNPIDGLADAKKALFKQPKTLSEKEAAEYAPIVTSTLQTFGELGDKGLRWRTQDPNMLDIWGDLSDKEAGVLSRLLIRRGQKNPYAAQIVRNLVESDDYISAAVIAIPRFIKTIEQDKKRPRKPPKDKKHARTN